MQEERARNEIATALKSKNADDGGGLSRVEIDAAVKYAEVNITLGSIEHCVTSEILIGEDV